MSTRFTKQQPQIVWFLHTSNGYYGPYVNKPKGREDAIPYELRPITQEEAKIIIKNNKIK